MSEIFRILTIPIRLAMIILISPIIFLFYVVEPSAAKQGYSGFKSFVLGE